MPNLNKLIIDLIPAVDPTLGSNVPIKLIIKSNPRNNDGKITLNYYIDSFSEVNNADSINVIVTLNGNSDIITIAI
jgi:hypothetical protein